MDLNTDFINKTDIIFDSRFKSFIKNLQHELIREYFHKVNPYINFNAMHDWIENRVKERKGEVNCDGTIANKPNLFAINICLLLEIDLYDSFEELQLEKLDKLECTNFSEENGHDKIRCACGKKNINPNNTFYIYSNVNPIKIQLGESCIEKIGIAQKNIIKKLKSDKKKMLTHRKCTLCEKFNILLEEPYWKKSCKPCWKKNHISNL